jgi:hypothetical protein
MKPQTRGRTPDWEFRYLNKDTEERGQVGAAWTNDDGSIRVKLNPCVVLRGGAEYVFTLFKWNSDYQGKTAKVALTKAEIDHIDF